MMAIADCADRALASRMSELPPLLNIPLDIASEIFRLVHPLDLLQLARSSKILRAYLMSRSSASIWAASRQQVQGLPSCPSFLSEAQFADLAFEHHCQNCLESQAEEVIWTFWARHCLACWNNLLTDNNMTDQLHEGLTEGILPQELHPFYHINVFETPRIMRYRPNVEALRRSLSNTTNDKTKQVCITLARELTNSKNKDAFACQQWHQYFKWARFLEQRDGRDRVVSPAYRLKHERRTAYDPV